MNDGISSSPVYADDAKHSMPFFPPGRTKGHVLLRIEWRRIAVLAVRYVDGAART